MTRISQTRLVVTVLNKPELAKTWLRTNTARLAAQLAILAVGTTPAIAQETLAGELPPVSSGTATMTSGGSTSDAPVMGMSTEKPSEAPAAVLPTVPALGRTYNQPSLAPADTRAPDFVWSDKPPTVPAALSDAIEIVTHRDPAVQAAWMEARAAYSSSRAARWLRGPSLSTGLDVVDARNSIAPTVTVEVPIWTAGRIGSSIRRAKHLEAASIMRWQETVLALAVQTSETYFSIVLSTKLLRLYEESLAAHRELVGSMERRVKQEISPLADLELARSRAAQIEQEMLSIRANRDTSLRVLAELVRDPEYRLGAMPSFSLLGTFERWQGVEEEAIGYSPTRWRLTYEADAAREQIAVAKSSFLPQLNAQYSYNEIIGSRVGLGVRLQVSNGLSQFSEVSAFRARYEAAQGQIQLAERQLRQDVANQAIAYDAALLRAFTARSASDTAERVSESYMRQFIAGRRSWLDVMNSLREHLSAQVGLAQSEVTALSTNARLNLQSGRWKPLFVSGEE